jgi:taurine--2-oxoglutarate transaminase
VNEPLAVVDAGRGSFFLQADGTQTLDMCAQLANLAFGHSPHDLVDVFASSARRLTFACHLFASGPKVELAARLSSLVRPTEECKVVYSLSGSEAVEGAIRLARVASGKRLIVTFYDSYHGHSYVTGSAGELSHKWDPDHYFDSQDVVYLNRNTISDNSLVTQLAEIGAENIAAVVMEPIACNDISQRLSAESLTALTAFCRSSDIYIVADEILSGFGRTGKMFAYQHFPAFMPDMICMSKGITAGVSPLSVNVITSTSILEFFSSRPCHVGSTMAGHPPTCAVALAVLDKLESEHILEHVATISSRMAELSASLEETCVTVGSVTTVGAICEIKLTPPPGVDDSAYGGEVKEALLRAGLNCFVRRGQISLMPPLNASLAEVNLAFATIRTVLAGGERGPPPPPPPPRPGPPMWGTGARA